ncbi:MAG: glycoside hydrolase family 95 protein, partial [Planctomycetia bacterium]|nr:glycoside hydrolase family 95 protein [Planctomycetia bacterium]
MSWLLNPLARVFLAVTITLSISTALIAAESPSQNILWYNQPVPRNNRGNMPWDQGMPIGNGRLGGMVFGETEHERIQLNEDTLWVGGPRDTNNPEALANLPKVRKLLFDGKPGEAINLANQKLMGRPSRLRPYQTLGDLWIDFKDPGKVSDYRRELDMPHGIATVAYQAGDAHLRREVFCSAPDQVMVVRLTSDQPAGLSFSLRLTRAAKVETNADAAGRLEMHGRLDNEPGDAKGLEYHVAVRAVVDGGKISADGDKLVIDGAKTVTLLLAGETSYRQPNPAERARHRVDAAAAQDYEKLRERHVADFSKLFDRVDFKLDSPDEKELAKLPTDERLRRVQRGGVDLGLVTQYFQFGRYLLISSSRPGTQPANLQGIWADGMNPPWNSDYHLNINVQMNYWPAETTNLAELQLPLVDFIESLREPGRKTAKVHYGASKGWVAHHISDPWGFTTPGDGAQSGLWPTGGAWLCRHLWDHYDFSHDKEFLARAYPTMKESAEFFLDAMVADPKGRLV